MISKAAVALRIDGGSWPRRAVAGSQPSDPGPHIHRAAVYLRTLVGVSSGVCGQHKVPVASDLAVGPICC